MIALDQGFPTWGTCTPMGTFQVSNRREKYLHIIYFQIFIHISMNIIAKLLYAYC